MTLFGNIYSKHVELTGRNSLLREELKLDLCYGRNGLAIGGLKELLFLTLANILHQNTNY